MDLIFFCDKVLKFREKITGSNTYQYLLFIRDNNIFVKNKACIKKILFPLIPPDFFSVFQFIYVIYVDSFETSNLKSIKNLNEKWLNDEQLKIHEYFDSQYMITIDTLKRYFDLLRGI